MADQENVANVAPKDPYHEMEFEVFLKEIGNANLPNWTLLAEALNVNRATVARWRNHPLAKQAISAAIEETFKKMQEVGATDWKMHREKLKMLGIKDKSTIEHEGEIDLNMKGNKQVAKELQDILTTDDKPQSEENTGSAPDNQ